MKAGKQNLMYGLEIIEERTFYDKIMKNYTITQELGGKSSNNFLLFLEHKDDQSIKKVFRRESHSWKMPKQGSEKEKDLEGEIRMIQNVIRMGLMPKVDQWGFLAVWPNRTKIFSFMERFDLDLHNFLKGGMVQKQPTTSYFIFQKIFFLLKKASLAGIKLLDIKPSNIVINLKPEVCVKLIDIEDSSWTGPTNKLEAQQTYHISLFFLNFHLLHMKLSFLSSPVYPFQELLRVSTKEKITSTLEKDAEWREYFDFYCYSAYKLPSRTILEHVSKCWKKMQRHCLSRQRHRISLLSTNSNESDNKGERI